MIDPFPIFSDNRQLVTEDFTRFSVSFAEILKKRIPTATQVDFCLSAQHLERVAKNHENPASLLELFNRLVESPLSCGIQERSVMLPFTLKDGTKIVAVVTGGDDVFYKKVREDWLLEVKENVLLDFQVLKQARVDVQTGFLNVSNLYSLLETHGKRKDLQLILLELPPRRSSLQYVLRYTQKCAATLHAFAKKDTVLHYLGHCIFGLILVGDFDGQQDLDVGGALVVHLKRAGCHRVHIGCSSGLAEGEGKLPQDIGKRLLDQAWTALKHAKNRGPFSFCNYASLVHPEKHPFALPDRSIMRRLKRMWAGADRFCLVNFCCDDRGLSTKNVVLGLIDRGVIVEGGNDVFVYLEEAQGREGVEWAKEVVARASLQTGAISLSAGVSCYPFGDFRKADMIINCRKALLHAAFYGHPRAALFDAVSLNISGDVYFSDGDLTRAVREYKRGLTSDDQDVNLHNSLGVALAMMNKMSPAMKCFENGLEVDPHNFMALYNLGLAEQGRDHKKEALVYFQKALQYHPVDDEHADHVQDLKLQIGILSCEIGLYEQAIYYLVHWQQQIRDAQKSGRIAYYLGRSYHGIGDNRRATGFLQQALRFDEFDDRAMNLLGSIYLMEGEGNEIALTLVRKSVELEPSCIAYRLTLATVLLRCRLYEEARENIYRCLKHRSTQPEARLLLAESFAQEGLRHRAAIWYKKVLSDDSTGQDLQAAAQKGLAQLLARE